MGAIESSGGGNSQGCIGSAFSLFEAQGRRGQVIWDSSVGHAYYVTEGGQVLNTTDQGFDYPQRTYEELDGLMETGLAISLKSIGTAPVEILDLIEIQFI